MRRAGILGAAKVARSAVVQPGLVQVVAVASRSAERAQLAAHDIPGARAVTGYQALLDDPDVEIVSMALPPALQPAWAEKAAAAGKHVLVEKPLARTVEEVDRVAAAGRARNVTVMETMALDFHSWPSALARSGPVEALEVKLAFTAPPPGSYRRDVELGGGVFWDAGPYFAALVDVVFGPVPFQVVQARGWGWRSFACELELEGGQHAKLMSVFEAPHVAEVRATGPQGELSLHGFLRPSAGAFPVSLEYVRPSGDRIDIPFPPSSYAEARLAAFLAACANGYDPGAMDRVRRRTAILQAVWRAAGGEP